MSIFDFRDEFLPRNLNVLAERMFPTLGLFDAIVQALTETRVLESSRAEIPHALVVLSEILASLYRHEDRGMVYRRCLALLPGGSELAVQLSPGSFNSARTRLPSKAVARVLELLARRIPVMPTFYGLVMKAMDGSYWTLPDSKANADRFGRSKNQNGNGLYPKMLAIGLITVYDRVVRRLRCYRYNTDEHKAAFDFLEDLVQGDLLLLDRGFPGRELFIALAKKNVKVIARISNADWSLKVIRQLSEGDTEVEFAGLRMRLIEFIVGNEPVRLMTSLPTWIPKEEFFELYHQRWIIETVWGFLKNILAAARHGKQDIAIRGHDSESVLREIYSHAIVLNLVSTQGARAAEKQGNEPEHFSFSTWVGLTRIAIENDLPIAARHILMTSSQAKLPNRTPGRVYKRTVRAVSHKFPVRSAKHQQERQTPTPTFVTTKHTRTRAPATQQRPNKPRGRPVNLPVQ